MRILAFDCAGAQCAAAVLAGNDIVAVDCRESERGHAQLLMPLLVGLLAQAKLDFGDLDRIAVTTGPGSFTGIRVALAAARGLALGTGKPVIGITAFEALAHAAAKAMPPTAQRLLIAVESRRAECFVQLFDRNARPTGEPAMLTPEAVAAWAGDESIAVAGDAALRILPHLPQAMDMGDAFARVDVGVLARVAAERIPGLPPAPFYLRAPDAVPSAARRAAL